MLVTMAGDFDARDLPRADSTAGQLPVRTVVLCGGPDVAVDGQRLRLTPPKRSQAVLAVAYLLLDGGRPVPADQLAEAVWPKGPPASWSSGLRRVVSDVRTWLRSGGIEADVRAAHGTYELLLPRAVTTDVDSGLAALRSARAAEHEGDVDGLAERAGRAVALLGGPLLDAYDAAVARVAPGRCPSATSSRRSTCWRRPNAVAATTTRPWPPPNERSP